MNISIIIPCLNEVNYLPYLLQDLKAQTVLPNEIIIVDAGSTDGTLDLVMSDEIVKVYHSKPNIGAQRQLGGEKSQGEFLFFLDSDVRLHKKFLESALDEVNRRKIDLGAFQYVPYSLGENGKLCTSTFSIRLCYKFFDLLFYIFQKMSPSGAGSGIFVTRSVFESSKGFRNDLKFDDIEFIRRAARSSKFGHLRTALFVSDRRFVRYGVLKIFFSYIFLSVFFFLNLFKLSEILEYKFSDY